MDPGAGEAELRGQVERFEQLKSAAAAAQARASLLEGRLSIDLITFDAAA